MSYLFPSDRSLLYPQFETYRLNPQDSDENVSAFALPGVGATQSRVGYNSHHLSFKEVRARISWDHLAVRGNVGVYIDKEWNVIGIKLGENLIPTFYILGQLPTPVSSSSTQPEYPSAVALTDSHWAVSTGSGFIYILEITADFSGVFTARYDLPGPSLLRSAHTLSETQSRLLLSRTIQTSRNASKEFELFEIIIGPTHSNGVDDDSEPPDIRWRLLGTDLPYWTTWWKNGWIVLSGESFYEDSDSSTREREEERIRREKLDTTGKRGLGADQPLVTEDTERQNQAGDLTKLDDDMEAKQYPYSWKQTLDSLSISFEFPAGTSRSDLTISLDDNGLSLSLSEEQLNRTNGSLRNFLAGPKRQWWSEIDSATSTYTFDSSSAKSRLEIEISKKETHTRWPSVFFPLETESDDDDEEEEVPETIDADAMAAFKAQFNSIHSRDPDGPEPEGNHPSIPALLREEMDYDLEDDEEFDAGDGVFADTGSKVGREVFIGYIGSNDNPGESRWSKTTTTVLSIPFGGNNDEDDISVLIKSAVDGLLFTPNDSESGTKTPWRHVSTSPALSFVLSSKRDIRLVRHFATSQHITTGPDTKRPKLDLSHTNNESTSNMDNLVLAFDAGTSTSGHGQGNVYIYYPPSSKTTALQGVLGVSGGERGALLGVGLMRVAEKKVVAVLCEKDLVLLTGVV